MKILQVASLGLPVHPNLKYAGTERVIAYLDKAYSEMGHDSMVAATGDSKVSGTLIPTIPQSLWSTDGITSVTRQIKRDNSMVERHYKTCIDTILGDSSIDVVHDHPGSGLVTQPGSERVVGQTKTPILVTLHGAFSDKNRDRYMKWAEMSRVDMGVYFNAISHAQKRIFQGEGLRVEDVIYHGLPLDRFGFQPKKEDYLLHLGRISLGKGTHIAAEVAKKTGRRLLIAGEVHSVDDAYWNEKVKPLVDGDQIQFIGPQTDEQKIPLYQNAAGFIFPLQWEEPFGLVMIEAMATGTPVIAYSRGSVPEVVRNGKTGFVIQETGDSKTDLEAMVSAVNKIESINPVECRSHVEQNFSIGREAENYLNLYKRLIDLRIFAAA